MEVINDNFSLRHIILGEDPIAVRAAMKEAAEQVTEEEKKEEGEDSKSKEDPSTDVNGLNNFVELQRHLYTKPFEKIEELDSKQSNLLNELQEKLQ